MPPPRRTLPLRPWRPPRTSAYVRWASDGPRDPKRVRPDDSAPGGGEPAQSAATEVNANTNRRLPTSQPSPAGSWPGGLASRASTLLSPSIAPAPPEDTSTSEHAREQPSGTTCLVCKQDFHTTSALRHHITIADHAASWPVAFSTHEEAIRRRKLWSQFNAQGWKSPFSRARRKGGERSCDNCSTPIHSIKDCVKHLLSNEECTKSRAGLASEYACSHCLETLETTEHVRQHIKSSPVCKVHHIKIRTVELPLHSAAENNLHSYIHHLIAISSELKHMAFPIVAPILHSVLRYLNSAYREAKQTRDTRMLQALGPSSQIHEDVRISYAIGKPTREWAEQRALHLAHKGHQGSIRVLVDIYRDLQAFDSMPATLMRKSIVRYLRPVYHAAAKQKDQVSIRHNIEKYPDICQEVQREDEVVHQTGKEDHNPTKAAAQITRGKSPSKTEQLVLAEEPPVSSMDPQHYQDLKMELQKLKEQVKLLQGKIGGQAILNADANSAFNRRYEPRLELQFQNEQFKASLADGVLSKDTDTASPPSYGPSFNDQATKLKTDGQRLVRQFHKQAASMESSENVIKNEAPDIHPDETTLEPSKIEPPTTLDVTESSESNNPSLLDELFPESSTYIQPHYTDRNPYPKLDLPDAVPLISTYTPKEKLTRREIYMKAFQRSTEKLTALQLLNCSTELTESDFRRIVPGGRHIEGWDRDGGLHKIIPGRDPLSLERLPFYFLVFKSPDAAQRYQSKAARLHALSKLHGPTSVMSAFPPPIGVFENGEDIKDALSSYLLTPASQPLQLNMVMQPYKLSLSRLLEQGGYTPIVPATTPTGKPIYKVLMHIEGYESSPYDVYQLFMQDATKRGISWPFLQEHQSVRRLRDIIDMKTRYKVVATANPRAARSSQRLKQSHDPYAAFLGDTDERGQEDVEEKDPKTLNQFIMNKVYNRWIIEFSEEEGAKRFARLWHRKILPVQASVKHRTWRDLEEVRMCNAEYLW